MSINIENVQVKIAYVDNENLTYQDDTKILKQSLKALYDELQFSAANRIYVVFLDYDFNKLFFLLIFHVHGHNTCRSDSFATLELGLSI